MTTCKCGRHDDEEIDLDAISDAPVMTREEASAARKRALFAADMRREEHRLAGAAWDVALLKEMDAHPASLMDRAVIQTEPFAEAKVVSRTVAAWIRRNPRP